MGICYTTQLLTLACPQRDLDLTGGLLGFQMRRIRGRFLECRRPHDGDLHGVSSGLRGFSRLLMPRTLPLAEIARILSRLMDDGDLHGIPSGLRGFSRPLKYRLMADMDRCLEHTPLDERDLLGEPRRLLTPALLWLADLKRMPRVDGDLPRRFERVVV